MFQSFGVGVEGFLLFVRSGGRRIGSIAIVVFL